MAQNEMKAKPALPERVRSMEGLGVTVCPELTLDEKGGYSSVGCFVEDGGGPPGAGLPGAGFKPPRAAGVKSPGGERRWKRRGNDCVR